jgi:hypothetical protein
VSEQDETPAAEAADEPGHDVYAQAGLASAQAAASGEAAADDDESEG